MGSGDGSDTAGLYSATSWDNDIDFAASSPFAMNDGAVITSLLTNISGSADSSFYPTISFDMAGLRLGNRNRPTLGDVMR